MTYLFKMGFNEIGKREREIYIYISYNIFIYIYRLRGVLLGFPMFDTLYYVKND